MWLDLRLVALNPDRRVATPTLLTSSANIKSADAEAMADKVSQWWTDHLNRELWANTWVARVPGHGNQWLEIPRWPIWQDPPVVTPLSDEVPGVKYDTATYRVAGECRQLLYRSRSWPWTAPPTGNIAEFPAAGLENPDLQIGPDAGDAAVSGFRAGYFMPGEVSTWTPTTTWGVGASTSYDSGTSYGWAKDPDRTNRFRYEVTAGSGAEAVEPTWPMVDGEEFVGANVTFTAREFARELPQAYVSASLPLARLIQRSEDGGDCVTDKERRNILKMVEKAC